MWYWETVEKRFPMPGEVLVTVRDLGLFVQMFGLHEDVRI